MSTDQRWYLDVNGFTRRTPWLQQILAAYALCGALTALALVSVVAYLVARQGRAALRPVAITACTGLGTAAALFINQSLLSRPSPGPGPAPPSGMSRCC